MTSTINVLTGAGIVIKKNKNSLQLSFHILLYSVAIQQKDVLFCKAIFLTLFLKTTQLMVEVICQTSDTSLTKERSVEVQIAKAKQNG